MNKIVVFLLMLLLSSCQLLRKVDRVDREVVSTAVENNDKKLNETIDRKTTITESGGVIATDLIPLADRYDEITGLYRELMQTFKDGGITKTIYYRPDGSTRVDCTAQDRVIETLETIDREQSETNSLVLERLDRLETEKIESEKVTKGINMNIIIIALIAAVFLFVDKKF